MRSYYVEFHGEEPSDEIGTLVDASDPDEAVGTARRNVMGELQTLEGQKKLGITAFEFSSWRIDKVMAKD